MSSKPVVIMLGHKSFVGKDTLGAKLIDNENFIRIGFADKLKAVVADLYNFTDDQMYGGLKNVKDERYYQTRMNGLGSHGLPNLVDVALTPREILQDFGQEQRRRFPDIWADYVFRQIEEYIDPEDNVLSMINCPGFIITDFRFPNEFTVAERYAVKLGLNIVPIEMIRPDISNEFAGAENISETALDNFQNWSHKLSNDGSVDDLYDKYKSLNIDYGGEMGSTGNVRTGVSV